MSLRILRIKFVHIFVICFIVGVFANKTFYFNYLDSRITAVATYQLDLYDEPNGNITEKFSHKEMLKIPLAVEGDWMKIKLKANPPESLGPSDYGKEAKINQRVANADGRIVWVKWRENGKVFVTFFYGC